MKLVQGTDGHVMVSRYGDCIAVRSSDGGRCVAIDLTIQSARKLVDVLKDHIDQAFAAQIADVERREAELRSQAEAVRVMLSAFGQHDDGSASDL